MTDPSLEIFKAADLERSILSTIGPSAIKDALRARKQGYRQVAIEGDKFQQGGVLLIDRDRRAAFFHRNDNVGDHADPAEVVAAARALPAA